MPTVTASLPPVGLKAYFVFKDPIADFVRSRTSSNDTKVSLEITSIVSMDEMRLHDFRDPYQYVYLALGLSEVDYAEDYRNKVPVITFKHTSLLNKETYMKIPLNYLASYSDVLEITYMNKCIVMDLGKLPTTLDTTVLFSELSDVVQKLSGVSPVIKEVSVGEVDVVSQPDHEIMETVRQNAITVRKSLAVRYEELNTAHSQLLARIQALNITLG